MHRLTRSVLVVALALAVFWLMPVAQVALAASDSLPADTAGSATVTAAVLNVRSGPGTGYNVVNKVTQGTVLTVNGQDAAGAWLQVQASGGIAGWVSSQFVTTSAVVTDTDLPVRLVAPSIGLDTRVVPTGWHTVRNADGSLGSDWDVPAYAAGWLTTSARPGQGDNTVLAGHHNIEGEVFRYVVNLNPGDRLTLYTAQRAIDYQVVDRFILPDKYVSYAQRLANAQWIGSFGDERLTLVTCWPYTNNTHRVIVIAKPAAQGN